MAIVEVQQAAKVPAADQVGLASQRQLVLLICTEHNLAVVRLVVIALIYLIGAFCEFVAPRTPDHYDSAYTMLAPQPL
jgi:peptide/nickel transport system permease protein